MILGFKRRQFDSQGGGFIERLDEINITLLAFRRSIADKVDNDRFTNAGRRLQKISNDSWGRRLGDKHDDLGGRVVGEQRKRLLGGDRTDFFREIAATGAQRVGDAAAQLVNARRHLLETGA